MIADTSLIIDIMKSEAAAVNKIKDLENKGVAVMTTSISIFELFVGVTISIKQDQERKKIMRILDGLSIIGFDEDSAKEAGRIFAEKRKAGLTIDPEDAMIAGICVRRNETIITRNRKHFEGIEDLKLDTY